ncbi:hypothetical protein ABVK25_011669 [Lepraria finkii]|uniref:Uncharacterized protein n=1 Tax=Lepraria finkii TaxID=1340010 RepID=A0ABR4AMC7_9LECA
MTDSPPRPRAAEAAYLEDYSEEAQTTLPGTRQTANVTAKRSKPECTVAKVVRDEFSDSGYSSHTAATLGSTDSSLESKSGSNPLKVDPGAVAIRRRPTIEGRKPQSRRQSPEKPLLQRIQSRSRKEEVAQSKRCSCSECVAKARRRSTINGQTSDHYTSHAKIQARPPPPVRPHSTKPPPAQVSQDVPILPQPRPRPSQLYHRARPTSFHAGAIPELIDTQQPLYVERPSPRYPAASPFSATSYPPPQASYFPPQQLIPQHQPQEHFPPPISPYENQTRPRPQRWTSEYPASARPQSMSYTPSPIIEYTPPVYPVIAPSSRPPSRQPSHRERPTVSPEEYPSRDEDYYKMPPPPPRINTGSRQDVRPTIRKANTTSDAYQALHGHRATREEINAAPVTHRSPIKQRSSEQERSRRPSPARPTKTIDERVPSTQALEQSMARMTVESNGKNKRRASIYGHESLHDLESSIEDYQASKGTRSSNNDIPLDAVMRRKKTNTSSSDTSSRHSGKSGKSGKTSREGSDVKSRRPSSDIKSRHNNDGLAMRFNAAQGINLDIRGGYEGRTISLKQSKDEGEMELNIGSRGRTVGSRPARPAAEEKGRRRHSNVHGEGVTELERSMTTSGVRGEIVEADEPRIARERIITTSRSRRSSRSGYSGRGQAE